MIIKTVQFTKLKEVEISFQSCSFGFALFKNMGFQRDVVYLCGPIAPSYVGPNAEGAGGVPESQPMRTAVHMEPK
jgi:hypothetical protein